MRAYLFIILLLSIGCVKQWWQNSNVPDLTTQDFFDNVGKDKWVFVKFYTTWCGYCRKMSSEFDKLYDMIKNSRSDILIRRLEGDSNEDITYAYDIHSFPKLVLYKPGSVNMYALYQGYRTADEMFKFLNHYATPVEPVKEEVIKIAALGDKNDTKSDVKVEEKNKTAVNATAKGGNKRNATRTKKSNDTNVEEFKNNTKIEVPVVEDTATIDETLNKKNNENKKNDVKKEELELKQRKTNNVENVVKTNDADNKEVEEINFLKDEVKYLSEKLNSMQSEMQKIKSQTSTNLKPHDIMFFGVIIMVILAVILTIKKIYNKIKVS